MLRVANPVNVHRICSVCSLLRVVQGGSMSSPVFAKRSTWDWDYFWHCVADVSMVKQGCVVFVPLRAPLRALGDLATLPAGRCGSFPS